MLLRINHMYLLMKVRISNITLNHILEYILVCRKKRRTHNHYIFFKTKGGNSNREYNVILSLRILKQASWNVKLWSSKES